MNEEEAIQNIYKKIEREKALINAANAMRASTTNEAVRSRLDSQMRDGRRNLQFFEEKLRDIQMRRVGQGIDSLTLNTSTPGSGSHHDPEDFGSAPAPPPKDASGGRGDPGSMGLDLMPPRSHADQGPGSGIPKARPNFTKLGPFHSHPRPVTDSLP
jgi:classical protein kinase C